MTIWKCLVFDSQASRLAGTSQTSRLTVNEGERCVVITRARLNNDGSNNEVDGLTLSPAELNALAVLLTERDHAQSQRYADAVTRETPCQST